MLLTKKKYKAGDVIVHEKALGNNAYIIESGRVEVSRKFGDQRIVFATLDQGAIFGEMRLIDQLPRSATVTAVEDTTLSILGQAQFQNVLNQLSPPVLSIIKVMTERLRLTGSLVNPLKLTNFYYSLCSLIYFLVKAEGSDSEEGQCLSYQKVLSDCSTILALEKDQVEKVVNRMVLTKLVRLDRAKKGNAEERNLVITDIDQFKKFIDFLRLEVAGDGGRQAEAFQGIPEKTYAVLNGLMEKAQEFQPKQGEIELNYERCLQLVEDFFQYPAEESNAIFQPLIQKGIFNLSVDPETGAGILSCPDLNRLKDKLEEQEGLRVFRKMVDLLKTLAG